MTTRLVKKPRFRTPINAQLCIATGLNGPCSALISAQGEIGRVKATQLFEGNLATDKVR
jgi:hypothetical protein